MDKTLTKKQKKVLAFYQDKVNWRPPTLRAIREHMKLASDQSVLDYLATLKKKGYL